MSNFIARPSKYKNAYASSISTKPIYQNIKIDVTATTKLKCSDDFFGVPLPNALAIFPLSNVANNESIKIESITPLNLAHNRGVSDFEFSPLNTLIATSSRNDGIVRLWNIPDDITLQDSQREITQPESLLRGHEKTVENIQFHPTVANILFSASTDSTARLWDLTSCSEKIKLTVPNDSVIQSASFDYNGDLFAAASSMDAYLHIFDARAKSTPKIGKEREIQLFDLNAVSKGPIKTIPIEGSGFSPLLPLWDTSLPILYVTSKCEGVRIFELAQGDLSQATILKAEKQATALDLMPKSVCNSNKCEIARFIRLGTDNAVDTTSINIPRVNCDLVFQEDLYPPVTVVDPTSSSKDWFDKKQSYEPLLVNFNELGKLTWTKSSTMRPLGNPLLNKSTPRLSRKSNASSISELALDTPVPLNLSAEVEIEKRGWFTSRWDPFYLSLGRTKIYIFQHSLSEIPVGFIEVQLITKVEDFAVGRSKDNNQVGLTIQVPERTWYLKFCTVKDREAWQNSINKCIEEIADVKKLTQGTTTLRIDSSTPVPSPNCASVPVTNFLGEILCLTFSDVNKSQWQKYVLVLDETGFLHFHADEKGYQKGSLPVESLNLSIILSIRKTDFDKATEYWIHIDEHQNVITNNVFQINTSGRVIYFRATSSYEVERWMAEIKRVVSTQKLLPACELIHRDPFEDVIIEVIEVLDEAVSEKSERGSEAAQDERAYGAGASNIYFPTDGKKLWLTAINGSLYYYPNNLSNSPIQIISSSQFDEVNVPRFYEDFENGLVSKPNNANVYSKNDGRQSGNSTPCFDVHCKNGSIYRHFVSSLKQQEQWICFLNQSKLESSDLLAKIGITSNELLETAIKKHKGETAPYLDTRLIQSGKQVALIAITLYGSQITVAIVECSYRSLKSDACFVLDAGNTVFHWNGPKSTRMCQARAMGVAGRLRKERGDRPKITIVEKDNWETMRYFLKALGSDAVSNPGLFNELPACPVFEQPAIEIYKVIDAQVRQRKMKLIYLGMNPSKNILESDSVFVLVAPPGEVFIWIWKKSTTAHKELGCAVGLITSKYLKKSGGLDCVGGKYHTVQKLSEDFEYVIWKEKFVDYEGSLPISLGLQEAKGNIVGDIEQLPIDIYALLKPASYIDTPVDNGKSTKEVYVIKDFTTEPVVSGLQGQFFREESYIVIYNYRINNGVEKSIIYFWQGYMSTTIQKGTSALMTIEMNEKNGGNRTQVRVLDGKEPKHFCLMFGDIITRLNSSADTFSLKTGFDIRQFHENLNCKAVECELKDLCITSSNVCVVFNDQQIYIWNGRFSNGNQQSFSKALIERLGIMTPSPKIINQDDPGSSDLIKLTEILEMESNYSLSATLRIPDKKPMYSRLFNCSGASGMVKIHEIVKFAQQDLDNESVSILDCMNTGKVWVWFGENAKTNEKVKAMESVLQYINLSSDHDPNTVQTIITYAFQEPIEFTSQFHGWTKGNYPKEKLNIPETQLPLKEMLHKFQKETFDIKELLGKCPENVDVTKIEQYLSEKDFIQVFNMTKVEFNSLKHWKRVEAKIKAGFY